METMRVLDRTKTTIQYYRTFQLTNTGTITLDCMDILTNVSVMCSVKCKS